jgi:P-type Na+/K+ transporter
MRSKTQHPYTQFFYDVWRNKFLFWSVVFGFVSIFVILYVPVINHDVFKHTGISWEWAIVAVQAILFFGGIEAWKWSKRIWVRRKAKKEGGGRARRLSSVVFDDYAGISPGEIPDELTDGESSVGDPVGDAEKGQARANGHGVENEKK